MRKYTLDNALKDLDRIDADSSIYEGWEISDEDDSLCVSINTLNEFLSREQVDGIQPLDVIYCSAEVQHQGEEEKRRPMLAVVSTGSYEHPVIRGMQITHVAPKPDKYRTQFRYELKDWEKMGLNEKCYVNYDHLVDNMTDDINFGSANNQERREPMSLTNRDARALGEELLENYSELLRLGYRTDKDRRILDYFMKYIGVRR